MTKQAWDGFSAARSGFRRLACSLADKVQGLARLQQALIDSRQDGGYPVETPAVYNAALDDVRRESLIRLILVADNPGRCEQAAENRRYLTTPAGKLTEKFFREAPSAWSGVPLPRRLLFWRAEVFS